MELPKPLGWGARIGVVAGVVWSIAGNWGAWTHGATAGIIGDMVGRAAFGGIVGLLIGRVFARVFRKQRET
jgi:hypothetical protein